MMTEEQISEVLSELRSLYLPLEDRSRLNFETPYEALVAVMLSAQCTDERVNMVTAELFKEHNTPETMLTLDEDGLKEYIKSCGLANAKAKNILASSRMILDEFGGEVPRTKEEILKLPGVGNKTANVVLSNAYGVPGLGVDTHVFRVANRIGLATGNTADKVEKELCAIIPKDYWTKAHHWFLWHGRKVCNARKPDCENCSVKGYCRYYKAKQEEAEESKETED